MITLQEISQEQEANKLYEYMQLWKNRDNHLENFGPAEFGAVQDAILERFEQLNIPYYTYCVNINKKSK